jgi:UDP-glucose 4-epimerase
LVEALVPVHRGGFERWLADLTGSSVAVVGAGGFIGAQVCGAALAAGARVQAFALGESWRLARMEHDQLEVRAIADWWRARDRGLLSAVRSSDAAFLLAYTPPPERELAAWLGHERAVNRDGVARLADAAGGTVVFTSSADVYGSFHHAPIDERVAPSPSTPYAVAKLETEARLAGTALLRISTVFGPGERGPRAIPRFARALLDGTRPSIEGDGSDRRDYVYVRDVAAAIVNAAAFGCRDTVNIGSGVARTTRSVLDDVAAVVGARPDPVFVPSTRERSLIALDIQKARDELHYEPTRDFRGALAEEVEWLRAHVGAASARHS